MFWKLCQHYKAGGNFKRVDRSMLQKRINLNEIKNVNSSSVIWGKKQHFLGPFMLTLLVVIKKTSQLDGRYSSLTGFSISITVSQPGEDLSQEVEAS